MFKKIINFLVTIFTVIVLLFISYYVYSLKTDSDVLNIIPETQVIENYQGDQLDNKVDMIEINKYKDLYSEIEQALINAKKKVNLRGIRGYKKTDMVFQMLEEVVISNPEVMYYVGAEYYKGVLTLDYAKEPEEIMLHQKLIRAKKEEILNNIVNDNMTDYDKVKTVHDYIIDQTRYDRNYHIGKEVSPESHTVYGTLINRVAVCDGYAKTMKYLLEPLDVETIVVSGKSKGMDHAWNIVKIENEYYHIDLTWDDPIMENGEDIIIYDYFNLNDNDISKTHTWNKKKYPACLSKNYNYFYYNDLIVTNYEEFYNILKKTMIEKKPSVSFKIKEYNENAYNVSNTIKDIAMNNIFNYESAKFTYSTNKNLGIVTVYFKYK